MKRRALAFFIVPAAFLAAATPASGRPKGGFEFHGGWAMHAMSAVNDTLASFNEEFGTALDPMSGGLSWGLGLRVWPHPDLLLRFGFERLSARSEDSGVTFDLGADAYTLSVTWFVPAEAPSRYGVGIGFGPLYAHGGLRADAASLDTRGEGFGTHVHGQAIVPLSGRWSMNAVLGYRMARVNVLRFETNFVDMRSDYSGAFLRVGLAWDGGDWQ